MSVPYCAGSSPSDRGREVELLVRLILLAWALGGAVGYMGDSFHVLLFSPQEAAGFVFSFKCPKKKKKIRLIIRRQEFVHGSFPKHLMSISAHVPGRTAQVSAEETVGEKKKAELRS